MSTATLTAPKRKTPHSEAPVVESATHQTELPHKRLFSAREYFWMAENGLFEGQRVELIDGEIITMPPITEPHSRSVARTATQLTLPLHRRFMIRSQSSFRAGEDSYPQPDIAVVNLDLLNSDEIPSQAALIVEISRTTLQYDRTTKASLYASIGIADYWIVNLVENQVEVCRQPIESQSAQFDHDYALRQIYRRGQSIALLEVPEVSIDVDAMLP